MSRAMFLRLFFDNQDNKLAMANLLQNKGYPVSEPGPLIEILVPKEERKRTELRMILAHCPGWSCVGPACRKGHFMVTATSSYAWGSLEWRCVEKGCDERSHPTQSGFLPLKWFIGNFGIGQAEAEVDPRYGYGNRAPLSEELSGRFRVNEPNNRYTQIPRTEKGRNHWIQGTPADQTVYPGIDYAWIEQQILAEALLNRHAADLRNLTRAFLSENWDAMGVYLAIVSKFAREFQIPVLLASQRTPLRVDTETCRAAAKSASFVDAFLYGKGIDAAKKMDESGWGESSLKDIGMGLRARTASEIRSYWEDGKDAPLRGAQEVDPTTEAELLNRQAVKFKEEREKTKKLELQADLYKELEEEADNMFRFMATLNLQDHTVEEQRRANTIIQKTKKALLRLRALREKKGG